MESFIKKNKHLPNFLEAYDEENGFRMNDLLQPVEELALYTIKQEKEIEKQNKKIEELEMQNKRIEE